MPITVAGLGSGLDVESLVTQLVAAERAPTDLRYARKQNSVESDLSAFGSLKSALSSFRGSFTALTSLAVLLFVGFATLRMASSREPLPRTQEHLSP